MWTNLRMQHSSLQHSDKSSEQKHDVKALFVRGTNYPIKSGTEALKDKSGENLNHMLLFEAAEEFEHVIHVAADNWIAVDRSIIKLGTVSKGSLFLARNDEMQGHGANRVAPTISFDHINPFVGRIHIASTHYPLKGAQPGDPNYEVNKQVAQGLDDWMRAFGRGRDLAFINGDFNLNDRKFDWSYNGHFTSMADELHAWQNTGHGPIDGFCSYDRDGRVAAKNFTVLNDHEFKLFSDHFLCRGVWAVTHVPNH